MLLEYVRKTSLNLPMFPWGAESGDKWGDGTFDGPDVNNVGDGPGTVWYCYS
eukprot:CAMPEP_0114548634 /NCGR_PEP_ID=MMETSP0114-20121206/5088_1 /TAXON_ID=31324 /ORGANISM="Goniomonas sp, Strain m" /LENGTH=51 /DNA_ID=CAMNT_0001733241 /DNA_START=26 /DNA_END=181 /DNA_ORIENTATION=-